MFKGIGICAVILLAISFSCGTSNEAGMTLLPATAAFIDGVVKEFEMIPNERKTMLQELTGFVRSTHAAGQEINLVFICTHNSRRSHMSQIWAQAASVYYNIPNVYSYSGGTETTAFNPRAIAALKRAGFSIEKDSGDENPVYHVTYSNGAEPLKAFSKKFIHESNPQSGFCAVMTCSDADEACPYVPGADQRIAIPFEDPKAFDGTPQESEKYDERCRQIAREIFYAFSLVNAEEQE